MALNLASFLRIPSGEDLNHPVAKLRNMRPEVASEESLDLPESPTNVLDFPDYCESLDDDDFLEEVLAFESTMDFVSCRGEMGNLRGEIEGMDVVENIPMGKGYIVGTEDFSPRGEESCANVANESDFEAVTGRIARTQSLGAALRTSSLLKRTGSLPVHLDAATACNTSRMEEARMRIKCAAWQVMEAHQRMDAIQMAKFTQDLPSDSELFEDGLFYQSENQPMLSGLWTSIVGFLSIP